MIEDYPLIRENPSDYENPEFREELMDILRRPYNLEEYKSLMQKAKYRHLMGGPEYSDGLKGKKESNTYGKSPLDYHPGRLIIKNQPRTLHDYFVQRLVLGVPSFCRSANVHP